MYQKIGIMSALRPARRDEPGPRPAGGTEETECVSDAGIMAERLDHK